MCACVSVWEEVYVSEGGNESTAIALKPLLFRQGGRFRDLERDNLGFGFRALGFAPPNSRGRTVGDVVQV